MKTISIAAPCNGSGKTSLILALLHTFPNQFAVTKFTTIYKEEQFCPVKDHDCACHRLMGDFLICEDPTVLSQPDTDTGKFWRAAPRQTLWCVARHEGYPKLVQEFLANHVNPATPQLLEGNTVVHFLKPKVQLYLFNPFLPSSRWKSDTEEFLAKTDWIIVNPFRESSEPGIQTDPEPYYPVLEPYADKCLRMENAAALNTWKDPRLYQAVLNFLGD
ncbi:MAG: hypothetical protein U0V70_02975 [Terriglobia bacterium]